MLYGADGIHEVDIALHAGNIMFQSHIFGDWNQNTWNENNYQQMRLSLEHLVTSQQIDFKTISEII